MRRVDRRYRRVNYMLTQFGGNVTSAGWQVTLCDSKWRVTIM